MGYNITCTTNINQQSLIWVCLKAVTVVSPNMAFCIVGTMMSVFWGTPWYQRHPWIPNPQASRYAQTCQLAKE